jgi:hypothetical protein
MADRISKGKSGQRDMPNADNFISQWLSVLPMEKKEGKKALD